MRLSSPTFRFSRTTCKSLLLMSAATVGAAFYADAPTAFALPLQDEATTVQQADAPTTPQELAELAKTDLASAEKALDQWMADNDPNVASGINVLASSYLQAKNNDKVVEIFQKGFDHFLEILNTKEMPTQADTMPVISMARVVTIYAPRSEKYKELTESPLLKVLETMVPEQLEAEAPNAKTTTTIALLTGLKQISGTDESNEMLDSLTQKIDSWLEQTPDAEEVHAAKLQLLASSGDTSDEVIETIKTTKEKFPESKAIQAIYFSTMLNTAGSLVYEDPVKADNLVAALKDELESLDLPEAEAKQFSTALSRMSNSIKPALNRLKLIGKPAPAFDSEAWVNGEATNLSELKGKVVLIDFWAIWCGPCIATFPHLREWKETYGEQGLEIIGVTSKYNYVWDEQQERAVRAEGEQSMDEELAMLDKFLAHHELKHRSMINPEGSKMKSEYGVSGIPQAVLIDKNGVIRLIKVGSGQPNADAIHEMIEKLLAE